MIIIMKKQKQTNKQTKHKEPSFYQTVKICTNCGKEYIISKYHYAVRSTTSKVWIDLFQ